MEKALYAIANNHTFAKYVGIILGALLNDRMRRIIYMASVMGLVMREKMNNFLFLDALNRRLNIIRFTSGLLFPADISKFIWRDVRNQAFMLGSHVYRVDGIHISNIYSEDQRGVADFFARNAPLWMKYKSEKEMSFDILQCLFVTQRAFEIHV